MAEKRTLDIDEPPSKRPKIEDSGSNEISKTEDITQDAQERAVGITVFVAPEKPGFECTVKQRYTDFLVNEILPSGEVVHLTDLHAPKSSSGDEKPSKPEPSEPSEPGPDIAGGATGINGAVDSTPLPELSPDDKTSLTDVFGDVTDRILKLHETVLHHPHRKPRDHPTIKSNIISDKATRTEAHKLIRRIFNSKLQTETLQDEPGVIAVKATPTKGASGARAENDGRHQTKGKIGWNDLGGEYLHFTLYKENKDTMEALGFIASQLKIPAKGFEFAGTKDRRGVTAQKVAVYRVRAERIAGLNKVARGWRVGGFEYKLHGLELGELNGNEFVLTLRDCHFAGGEGVDGKQRFEHAQKVVAEAAASFKTNGFLNYYGLQRFGTFSTGTHMVGMKMLQGDLKGAVDSILTYSEDVLPENLQDVEASRIPQDDIRRADAIRNWREGKVSGADVRDLMPRRFSAEAAIMQYLSKKDRRTGKLLQETDYQGALESIQRGLRLMYVHAYQSFVWNTVAGKRWELYGSKIVEGDLVIVGEKDGSKSNGVKDEVDQDGEPVVRPTTDDKGAKEDPFTRARPLSQQEAESGKYDIFDVVLPQPGFDVLYPANEVSKTYEDFMGSERGGGLDPHKMRRAWKDASLSGSYRKMMARPLNDLVECEVREYGSADEQLVETDLEKLNKTAANGSGRNGNEGEASVEEGEALETSPAKGQQKQIAIVMRFQLGSSQYATMALRELTNGGAKAYKPEFNAAR